MKVLAFFFVLFVTSLSGFSQGNNLNNVLIKEHITEMGKEPIRYKGFVFAFYKNHISKQILNDCIYDHSCSQFGHDVFKHFGLFKGMFLTADRLTRCNRASLTEMRSSRINKNGKAIDHWDDYAKSE